MFSGVLKVLAPLCDVKKSGVVGNARHSCYKYETSHSSKIQLMPCKCTVVEGRREF